MLLLLSLFRLLWFEDSSHRRLSSWSPSLDIKEKLQKNYINFCYSLKDSVTRFFASGFIMNQFSPSPRVSLWTVSNFFENSQRYSQVKLHHRYQRHRWQICYRCQRHWWSKTFYRRPPRLKAQTFWFGLAVSVSCHLHECIARPIWGPFLWKLKGEGGLYTDLKNDSY